MQRYSILWADDEIDLLKPHILFLSKKGYDITPVNNGADAIEYCEKESYDLVFLDENMPGMTGLETLAELKNIRPNTPVIMITKSEEEHIMEEAIGQKIADYLIKPINPSQILLSIKKLLDKNRLVTERTNTSYQQDFRNISMAFFNDLSHEDWVEIYRKLVYWDLEINETENRSMADVLEMQRSEANVNFAKFIKDNYESWLRDPESNRPVLSHELMRKKVVPLLEEDGPVFVLLIDNLRIDQWKTIEPIIAQYFTVEEDSTYYSILPTTTGFARNAIFAGLMPSEIQRRYPKLWVGDDEEGGKNNQEEILLKHQLDRLKLDIRYSYHKVIHANQGKQVHEQLHTLFNNKLNILVYNFVDMLSHARTDTAMIRELAHDEPAYRSITKSWLQHSPLLDTIKELAEKKARVIITTDHGTVRTRRPNKIIGDRNTNTNLRYKQGKSLSYDNKNLFEVLKPERLYLPKPDLSTAYVFATEDYFFAYPNNYNHYVKYYKDTFQHGGVSLEEMIVPFISLKAK